MLTLEQLKENAERNPMDIEVLRGLKNEPCLQGLYYNGLRTYSEWVKENQQLLEQYINENNTENANIAKRSLIVNLRNLANILEAGL